MIFGSKVGLQIVEGNIERRDNGLTTRRVAKWDWEQSPLCNISLPNTPNITCIESKHPYPRLTLQDIPTNISSSRMLVSYP
jgi:hypothetical protein